MTSSPAPRIPKTKRQQAKKETFMIARKNKFPREPLGLSVPTRAEWKTLVRELELSTAQQKALAVTLQHVSEDLAQLQARRDSPAPRGRLAIRLKRMEGLLAKVLDEMERAKADLIHFLPHDTLAHVGRAMTFAAMSEALGFEAIPARVEKTLAAKIQAEDLSLSEIESETLLAREVIGMKQGDLLLKAYIAKVHAPMRRWVEQDRQNKGGKPAQNTRRYLIYWLAWDAPDIIGRRAAIAVTGPFVELCAAVVRACGLPERGLAKAIPEVVRQVRADHGRMDLASRKAAK